MCANAPGQLVWMQNICLASELICSVPPQSPVRVTTRGYESKRALYIPGAIDPLLINSPSFPLIVFALLLSANPIYCQWRSSSVKSTQQTVFCLVTLCQVRLPSDLPRLHCCSPPGCQTAQSFNLRSFATVTGIFLSGLVGFFSVSLDNNLNQQIYSPIIDKINLYGAKRRGK